MRRMAGVWSRDVHLGARLFQPTRRVREQGPSGHHRFRDDSHSPVHSTGEFARDLELLWPPLCSFFRSHSLVPPSGGKSRACCFRSMPAWRSVEMFRSDSSRFRSERRCTTVLSCSPGLSCTTESTTGLSLKFWAISRPCNAKRLAIQDQPIRHGNGSYQL